MGLISQKWLHFMKKFYRTCNNIRWCRWIYWISLQNHRCGVDARFSSLIFINMRLLKLVPTLCQLLNQYDSIKSMRTSKSINNVFIQQQKSQRNHRILLKSWPASSSSFLIDGSTGIGRVCRKYSTSNVTIKLLRCWFGKPSRVMFWERAQFRIVNTRGLTRWSNSPYRWRSSDM